METIKVFYGEPYTGKTWEAKKIAKLFEQNEVLFIKGVELGTKSPETDLYKQLTAETKLVIIDDVSRNFKFESLFDLAHNGFEIKRIHADSLKTTPQIIVTTNHKPKNNDDSFLRRVELLEFTEVYQHPELEKSKRKIDVVQADILKNRDEYMRLLIEEHEVLKEELSERRDIIQNAFESVIPILPVIVSKITKKWLSDKPKESEETTEKTLNENDNN